MIIRSLLLSAVLGAAFLFPTSLEAGTVYWPCSGTVTSTYGPRSSPCSGCSTFHHGIDIGVGTGTDLAAPWNGSIASYIFESCGGNIMTINFGGGWQSRFAHTSSAVVGVGSGVYLNQHVAESGGTGSCTTGPHLHFEMRKDGVSQGIPGGTGAWVTRNAAIGWDYAGCGYVPPPAFPPVTTLAGWYRIITTHNKVFDLNGSSTADGANIQQWDWVGSSAQIFHFEHLGDGYYKITNKGSGKAIDVTNASGADGANIQQWTWTNNDAQKWRVEDVGGGNVRMVAKHSGKVADVAGNGSANGTNIHQWTWTGGNSQKFRIESVPVVTTSFSGSYRLIKKGTDDKALDLMGGGTANGTGVHLWQTTGDQNQVWNFELQSDNHYKITSQKSGNALDSMGSTANGALIKTWAWNGGNAQRWSVEALGDGTFRLVSKSSGKCLDVNNNVAANGAIIQQWSWAGGEQQRWVIQKAGVAVTNLAGIYTLNLKAGGLALDLANGGTADGTNIMIWSPTGSANQQFSFEHLGNAYYKITCMSGKVVEVAGNSIANAANVRAYTWNGGQNMRWKAELMEDGYYRFLAQHSGKALDAGGTTNGSNVQQWAWAGGDNQRWSLNRP